LRGPICPTVSLRLAWAESPQPYSWASFNCLPPAVVNRPSNENNWVQGDNFLRGIISYDSWGIRLHEGDRFTRSDWSGRINQNTLYRKGDHITWGDRLFPDTGTTSYATASNG